MTPEAIRALLTRWFEEVWNQGKESTIDELYHHEGKSHGWPRPDSVLSGPAAFKAIHRQFLGAFSGIRVTINDIVVDDKRDMGAVRWTCTMTHTGDSLGFPATRKTVTVPGASFMTFVDGKVMEAWNLLDNTRVLLELQTAANKAAAAAS